MEEELERDMTPRLIKDLGLKYPSEKSRQKYRYGLYKCAYCGTEWETTTHSISNSPTKSCGCQIGRGFKHGLESNRFYSTWYAMVTRCNNLKSKDYKHYGARGITVCEEWLDIKNFIPWAERTHPNTSGVSLDRIDNDKGYSPENCRWADKVTQNTNQRKRSTNTSGFVGVYWDISKNKWTAKIGSNTKLINIGSFKIIEEAVQARDNYILQNNLPHKLSTDYKREEA